MADQHTNPSIAALRKLEESLHTHAPDRAALERTPDCELQRPLMSLRLSPTYWRLQTALWGPGLRKLAYVSGTIVGLVMVAMVALWWRLASGPIDLDMITPWLTAAMEENFGSRNQIEIGGTQLERDANGNTALRIRDIVVRDRDGAIVASAPKAEVGVSGLLTGRVRAERLSLVGAEMAIRIEPDSNVTVFAGANKRPFVTASAAPSPPLATASVAGMASAPQRTDRSLTPSSSTTARGTVPDFAAILAWFDRLGASGLDGHDLTEIGLKNGNLTVDDQRNGKQWVFQDINLSLTRPKPGAVALTLSSESIDRPWLLRAAMTPGERGHRVVDIETQKLPARELMLAMRVNDVAYEPDMPLSMRIRADIGPDGMPRLVDGRIVVDKGFLVDTEEPFTKIAIDRAEFSVDWDGLRRSLSVPFQIVSGGNRITLLAQLEAPQDSGNAWGLKISGGTVVLADASDANPVILNRVNVRLRIDPDKQRVDVEQGEVGNMDMALALSGSLDFSGDDPRMAFGVAGTRMSVTAMKRIWPAFVTPKVRTWVDEHISGGTVERLVIATNAPWSTLKSSGPPVPDDGLSVEIIGIGSEIRPVEGLPAIRDADMSVRITGRRVLINLGRGNIEVSPGRKLAISNGVFEVPDTFPKAPPAKARFRLDGSIPAAAELLGMERLRDYSGTPIDPATSRGTLSAQVTINLPLKEDLPPGSSTYSITMDVANFAAEKLVMGQKVEAALLRVAASNQGYGIKGDVKLNGIPAVLDYRKPRGDADAEVRVQATLDDAARRRLGFDVGGYLSGAMPIKLSGKIPPNDGDSRYAVEVDLTQAKIDKLLPGWHKPAGRPGRATFTLINKAQATRFEDVVVEGPGTSLKGVIDLNELGEVVAANFPVFSMADGDKAMLKVERGPDGALRILIRGEVYDGRGIIKSALSGPSNDQAKQPSRDIDLDIKLGAVAGFNGETMRGLDLTMSRRGGVIKSFGLSAKLGRDAPLMGDLRGRTGGRNVIYVETKDSGAFFRFSDVYSKIVGGEMWLAMDPPTPEQTPQDALLNIRDFTVRGEQALDRVAASSPDAPGGARGGIEFSRLRVEFTRSAGRFAIREGIVRGPVIGATVEGHIDYMRDEVRMRGTFVPFYGLNNMFGQIPLFGLFLGGSNEGLVGLTYEVVGPPGAPVLRVNPISAVAPGLLRKFFEFPNGTVPQSYADPAR